MRRVCTRAASNGRWCRGPAFAAQLQMGGAVPESEKGRRGENSRNREDHLVIDGAAPPCARGLLPRMLTCWLGPCQRGDYRAAEKKKKIHAEKPGTSWYERDAHGLRERAWILLSSCNVIILRARRTRACATVKSSLVRTANNGCTLNMRNGLSSCAHSPRQPRKWEMHALSFKLINIGSAI